MKTGLNWLDSTYIGMTRNNLCIISISLGQYSLVDNNIHQHVATGTQGIKTEQAFSPIARLHTRNDNYMLQSNDNLTSA